MEQMKRQLRELIYRRDMLCYERDSLELADLIQELNEEYRRAPRGAKKYSVMESFGTLFWWDYANDYPLILVKSARLIISEKRGNMLPM